MYDLHYYFRIDTKFRHSSIFTGIPFKGHLNWCQLSMKIQDQETEKTGSQESDLSNCIHNPERRIYYLRNVTQPVSERKTV